MIIDDEMLVSSSAVSASPRRPNRRRAVIIGAATLAVAGVTVFAVVVSSGEPDVREAPRTTVDRTAQPAVTEQPVAEPIQVQAPRSKDDVVRDLVERGLIPAATLDDGTQDAGLGQRP